MRQFIYLLNKRPWIVLGGIYNLAADFSYYVNHTLIFYIANFIENDKSSVAVDLLFVQSLFFRFRYYIIILLSFSIIFFLFFILSILLYISIYLLYIFVFLYYSLYLIFFICLYFIFHSFIISISTFFILFYTTISSHSSYYFFLCLSIS